MPRLSIRELDAVIRAAGNVDVCMFEEDTEASAAEKDKMLAAYYSGLEKLRAMRAFRHETIQREAGSRKKP